MKIPVIAEADKIKLQRFAFHHALGGHVRDVNRPVVRLPGDGTERRELGAVEPHPVIMIRMFIRKGFQRLGRIVVAVVGTLLTKQCQTFLCLFSCHYNPKNFFSNASCGSGRPKRYPCIVSVLQIFTRQSYSSGRSTPSMQVVMPML